MVKAKIRNPAKIKRKFDISKISVVRKTQGITTRTLIRSPNRSVPLNPKAPLNKPRSGNFATKRRASPLG